MTTSSPLSASVATVHSGMMLSSKIRPLVQVPNSVWRRTPLKRPDRGTTLMSNRRSCVARASSPAQDIICSSGTSKATPAATSAPPLVPATASISMPSSRSARTTPMWAMHFDPPLDSARPTARPDTQRAARRSPATEPSQWRTRLVRPARSTQAGQGRPNATRYSARSTAARPAASGAAGSTTSRWSRSLTLVPAQPATVSASRAPSSGRTLTPDGTAGGAKAPGSAATPSRPEPVSPARRDAPSPHTVVMRVGTDGETLRLVDTSRRPSSRLSSMATLGYRASRASSSARSKAHMSVSVATTRVAERGSSRSRPSSPTKLPGPSEASGSSRASSPRTTSTCPLWTRYMASEASPLRKTTVPFG